MRLIQMLPIRSNETSIDRYRRADPSLPGQRFENQADASRKRDFYAQKSQKSAENLPLAPISNDRAFNGFALKVERE